MSMGMSLGIIITVGVLQLFFLDDLYTAFKKKAAERLIREAMEILKENDYAENLGKLSYENDIRIVLTREDGEILYSSASASSSEEVHSEFLSYVRFTRENGGKSSFYFTDDVRRTGLPPFDPKYEITEAVVNRDRKTPYSSMVIMHFLRFRGRDAVLTIGTLIRPLNTTRIMVGTLLLLVGIFMAGISVIYSYSLSRSFGKPIAEITGSAREIGRGNLDVSFPKESGTREIAELADTLEYAAGEIRKSEELQRELVGNVSHELRTPITMIKGYAEIMRDIPGENTPENLQVVIDEAERLTRLVNEILDLSQLQAKVMKLNPVVFSLRDTLKKLAERSNRMLEKRGYRIELTAPEDAFVYADEDKIYEVLYNFLSNALDYTGESRTVRLSLDVEGGNALVGVTDFGSRIPPGEIDQIFKRYYRSNAPENLKRVGSGVGLAIAKGVLDLHEASYGIRSTDDGETTFWFRLPLSGEESHG